MKIEYRKNFFKELPKLPAKYTKTIEQFIFDDLPNYSSLSNIGKVENMTVYKNYFKIRFDNYRAGIKKRK